MNNCISQWSQDMGGKESQHHRTPLTWTCFLCVKYPTPAEAFSALLSSCSLLYFQRCMGRHCISILGMMARRCDMIKQKWSPKSFAKQFDSRAQKL